MAAVGTSFTIRNITANHVIVATFAADVASTFTLHYVAGSNGTITGTLSQTVNSGASGAAVTAVADSGYHFLNWSMASRLPAVPTATSPLT